MKKFFRFIVLIGNIVVATALMLACLCSFVSPETVWWLGLFGLAYWWLLIINTSCIFFWLFSPRKKRIFISLIPILLGWPFVGMNVQFRGKTLDADAAGNGVKILSYNIQGFAQAGKNRTDGDTLTFFDFVRSENPDIVCLQEYRIRTGVAEFTEKNIRRELATTPYCHRVLVMQRYGVATFSRYPIVRQQTVYEDNTTNACICTDLLIGSDTVRIYNIHLKSVGFRHEQKQFLNDVVKSDYNRADISTVKSIMQTISIAAQERARQVNILAAHIRQSPHPVVVCGDFNDPPTSPSYRTVRGNLRDAFIEAGRGRSATFTIGHIASLRIDCILHADTFASYNYIAPHVHLSDHYPVLCELVRK